MLWIEINTSQAKVDEAHVSVRCEQYILGLQVPGMGSAGAATQCVPVEHSALVEILQSCSELSCVEKGALFGKGVGRGREVVEELAAVDKIKH